MKIFMSDLTGEDKISTSNFSFSYGKSNYSWRIISNMYRHGFDLIGLQCKYLTRPETFNNEIARKVLAVSNADIHVSIKPIEHLRYLRGVKNVAIAGWEFSELSYEAFDDSPFTEQVKRLAAADQIFCWTDFTKNNLHTHGLKCAITLPPPVFSCISNVINEDHFRLIQCVELDSQEGPLDYKLLNLNAVLRNKRPDEKIYVSVLNPFDMRKGFGELLEGFVGALEEGCKGILIVKLVIDNLGSTVEHINQIIASRYNNKISSNKVFFIGEELPEQAINALYSRADFYICASSAEGLNLPLVEAVAHGAIPITPLHTAMGCYLDEASAIKVSFSQEKAPEGINVLSKHMAFTHFPVTARDVSASIRSASQLTSQDYFELLTNAQQAIEGYFGFEKFSERLEASFAEK